MNRHRSIAIRSSVLPAVALLLAALASGCGESFGTPADPDDGRKALVAALDAWKAGGAPASLAQAVPPIRVADGDWDSGAKLVGYQADDQGRHVGADLNYRVVLELKNARGKVAKRNAVYAVSTRPMLMVLRQDD